jgi:hypothetical protein
MYHVTNVYTLVTWYMRAIHPSSGDPLIPNSYAKTKAPDRIGQGLLSLGVVLYCAECADIRLLVQFSSRKWSYEA